MKGVKGLLAEALAGALSEYFLVDPSMIETRLTGAAGIDLVQIELNRQHIDLQGCRFELTGSVQRVGFHWTWGKDAQGSDWIKDVSLVLTGLDFQARVFSSECGPFNDKSSEAAAVGEANKKFGSSKATKAAVTMGGVKGYIQ
jgi:hypothetical protein